MPWGCCSHDTRPPACVWRTGGVAFGRSRGPSPGEIAAAAGSVGANLLVLDSEAMSRFQLKRTVGEYCRTGIRPCPEVFRGRLS